MQRLLILAIFIILFSAGCSKCSKGEDINKENSQIATESDVVSANQEAQKEANIVDAGDDSGIMYPNVRFVQTPDGKVVPEPVLKLKLPKLLNPQVLKNAEKQQENGSNQKEEESQENNK